MGYLRFNLSKREAVNTKVGELLGSNTFISSTREVETELMWLGGERNIRWEETRAHLQSEDL